MRKSILIVDDDARIRELIKRFLGRDADFRVCGEAVDGFDAIDQAAKLHPDLVILDLSMPKMNGLDAARLLKATRAEMPIILFTMHADNVVPSYAEAAGVSAVVSKTDIVGLVQQARSLLQAV